MNFEQVTMPNDIYLYAIGIVVFLEILQTLRILRYNQTIAVFYHTLGRGIGAISSVTFIALIVIFGYAVLGYGLFGYYSYEYSSLPKCLLTLTAAFIGGFKFETVEEIAGSLGRVYLLIYLVTALVILLNFYISIIDQFLVETMGDPTSLPKEHEVIDYVMESLINMIVGKKSKECLEDEEPDHSNEDEDEAYIVAVKELLQDINLVMKTYKISAI